MKKIIKPKRKYNTSGKKTHSVNSSIKIETYNKLRNYINSIVPNPSQSSVVDMALNEFIEVNCVK